MKAARYSIFFASIAIGACRDEPRSTASGAASARATSSATVTRPPPPPPSAEELALIAPLTKGAEIGDFVLRDVRGVEDGVMRLVCAKGDATVRLDVALASDEGPTPPATAGPYAIYYSIKGATPEDGDRLAKKLAAVLSKHDGAPPPKGMTRFVPKEKPGTTL